MCNGKINKNYLLAKVYLYENLQPKSSVSLPPDPDSVVKELKHVHLQCYVCLDALKANFFVLDIVWYGWKVRGNYDRVQEQEG